MDEILIMPAPGRNVRDPVTMAPLAEKGERKPRSPYWLRRLRVGDVVPVATESGVTDSSTVEDNATEQPTQVKRSNAKAPQSGDAQ